jgi:hypothetical protein
MPMRSLILIPAGLSERIGVTNGAQFDLWSYIAPGSGE